MLRASTKNKVTLLFSIGVFYHRSERVVVLRLDRWVYAFTRRNPLSVLSTAEEMNK